jgi:glycosyltransferase involved in cell wall biosynthesis
MCDSEIKQPKVAVLLSTYNGERYLREQLDTIFGQTYSDLILVIRDDGSTDSTLKIIEEYKNRYPNIILIEGENVGCVKSFCDLARYVHTELPEISFFAFSDQDDVWLPEKIGRGVAALREVDMNTPGLYFCDSELVDKNLTLISGSESNMTTANFSLGESLMAGYFAGCTMMFNRKLLSLFTMLENHYDFCHDNWIYKICQACGGIIIPDRKKLILYRQHGNNEIGGNQSVLKKYIRRLNLFRRFDVPRSLMAKELLRIYKDYIPEENKSVIRDVAEYTDSFTKKLRLLSGRNIKSGKHSHNLMFRMAVLFNRF